MFLARDAFAGDTAIRVDHRRCGLSAGDTLILGVEAFTVADGHRRRLELQLDIPLTAPLENDYSEGTFVRHVPAPKSSGSDGNALLGLLALLVLLVPACYCGYKRCKESDGFELNIVSSLGVKMARVEVKEKPGPRTPTRRPRKGGPSGTPIVLRSPDFAEDSRLTDFTDSTMASPRETASPFSTPFSSPRPTESESPGASPRPVEERLDRI